MRSDSPMDFIRLATACRSSSTTALRRSPFPKGEGLGAAHLMNTLKI